MADPRISPQEKRALGDLSSTPLEALYLSPAFRSSTSILSSVFPRYFVSSDLVEKTSYRRAMESSLRNILHSNEPTYESSTLHTGHLPATVPPNRAFIGTLEAENSSSESRKRPATSYQRKTYPRKRAIQACQKCRVRRTKCNNERPSCSSCLSIGAECTYSEGDHSTYVE